MLEDCLGRSVFEGSRAVLEACRRRAFAGGSNNILQEPISRMGVSK